MRTFRTGLILCFAFLLSACGAGGILGLQTHPNGNIVLTNATNGATLQTSFASPFSVTSGGFSIGITEGNFGGPYTVTVVSWTAPFNIPCFVPHYADANNATNVVKFTADNAAPLTDLAQPSPCGQFYTTSGFQYDEETAHIADSDGHVVSFYYKLATP
jgi:hypothetical protein